MTVCFWEFIKMSLLHGTNRTKSIFRVQERPTCLKVFFKCFYNDIQILMLTEFKNCFCNIRLFFRKKEGGDVL